jgi:hypothetical protein
MNYANSFFKDLKTNSSINQLGTKLKKNISDLKEQSNQVNATAWLPETGNLKEQLVSAASEIQTAVNNQAKNPNLTKTESQLIDKTESKLSERTQRRLETNNEVKQYAPSTSSSEGSIKDIEKEPVIVQDMSQTVRVPSRSSSQQPSYEPRDIDIERVKTESPQPGSINLRDTPRHRSTSTGRRQQPLLPHQQKMATEANVNKSNTPTSSTSSMNAMPKSSSKNINEYYDNATATELVDSLELNALRETNDVLKSEVHRLSALEQKLKTMNKDSNYEREKNAKLESDLKEFHNLRMKCERLEAEIKQLKLNEEKSKMFQRNNDSNIFDFSSFNFSCLISASSLSHFILKLWNSLRSLSSFAFFSRS